MFNIKEGDALMVMGDKEKGIALIKDEEFYKLMGFMNGNSNGFSKDNLKLMCRFYAVYSKDKIGETVFTQFEN